MFPKVTQPKDGYRVVVWEHGTVGVGDSCAPSNNTINPRFKILADTLLAAGYVVIAPDYEGLGTRGMHPYLNLSSEAKSALAAVKAAKDHYGNQLNGAWMSIGQSQGGHASLGTAEFANNDANYKGQLQERQLQASDILFLQLHHKQFKIFLKRAGWYCTCWYGCRSIC